MSVASTEVRLLGAEASRDDLEEFLRQREALGFGILAISASDETAEYNAIHPCTMITIVEATPPPCGQLAVIEYHTPGPPPLADDRECVCIGRCYLAGAPANVLVHRPATVRQAAMHPPA